MHYLKEVIQDLLNLLYPPLCVLCSVDYVKGSIPICLKCLEDLSYTRHHVDMENEMYSSLRSRVPISQAGSLLYFQKGLRSQKLLHSIKYKSAKDLAISSGKLIGQQFKDFILEEDVLVPVPLHTKKFNKRGYNQSELLCEGIAVVCKNRVVTDALSVAKNKSSQTKKNRLDRFKSREEQYQLAKSGLIKNHRVWLIDDVYTTGATAEACITELLRAEPLEIGVLCLAFTA